MRLKFRARIKENGKKIMFYQNDQYLVSFLRRVTSFLAFEHDGEEGKHESYLDDYALEKCLDLFTGLLDKDGKEIYSGDIINHYRKDDDGKELIIKLEVRWRDAGFYLFALPGFYPENCKVIGNIFENKN